MSEPAYTRLEVDERRRRLLKLGGELFARHSYDELSMARIAREAGISKALLYHYFPSKQDYFVATLGEAAGELARITEPNPDLPPLEALAASLGAYLQWIEDNEFAYTKLIQSVGEVAEVRELVETVRTGTAGRILDGLGVGDNAPPKLRAGVRAWLWFMDGAIFDWLEHRDLSRKELRDLLIDALGGVVVAAGQGELLSRLADN